MTHAVEIEQAHQLREAETQWLRASAARLRAAHRAGSEPAAERVDAEEEEAR